MLLNVPGTPLISEAIAVSCLAGATGSASGGMGIALEALGPKYMELAASDPNLTPEALHRIASVASGGLDTLPHNGAVITLLSVCGLYVGQRPSDPGNALLDQSCDRGVVFLAERQGRLELALVDIVPDVPHEVCVNVARLVDHPPFLSEDVECKDGENQENKHEPSSLQGHAQKAHFLLVRNDGGSGGCTGTRISG